jgi:Tol biopolymer transport system component/DNA-binding winged helix-turn-helix (wHTH) protein
MQELLLVLIENQGRVVEKEFLLKSVWPDSFVEEGNISFNIRQLRKALADDAHSPTYIETVPRRGYRFIADVDKTATDDECKEATTIDTSVTSAPPETSFFQKFRYPLFAALLLFASVSVIGGWYFLSRQDAAAPVLSAPFATEKLSTTGVVFSAAISPDGKYVVYSSKNGDRQSVWLRELDSASNIEIIPPSDNTYFEMRFSPDGGSIYLCRGKEGFGGQIDIYRVPVVGGIPEKIVDKTGGWVSVSSDGKRLSFVRCPYTDAEYCSLWVADAKDGGNERKLLSRPRPIRIAGNDISPDGTKVAFAYGQSRNQGNEFRLGEVDIQSGSESEVTSEKFFNIKGLAWLPDQTGLLLTASRIPNKYFRIWEVSARSGDAKPLTDDSETYAILSLDRSASRLVSTQIKQDFHLYRFDLTDRPERRLLADATTSSYAPDGRIFFTSTMSGNDEIWSVNPDGSGQRQLTNNPADDRIPIVSPDNSTVYFTSNRTGEAQLWRMRTDGSNQTQVTQKEGGYPIFISSDGRSVYYRHGINGALWAVSVETGEEKPVFNQARVYFAVSPDASHLAFEETIGDESILRISSLPDGQPLEDIRMPKAKSRLLDIAWLPDGRSIMYIVFDRETSRYEVYQQGLQGGTTRQVADLGNLEVSEVSGLQLSPDGKSFAVVQGAWKHDAVLVKGLK